VPESSSSTPPGEITSPPPPGQIPGAAASRLIIDAIQPTIAEIRREIAQTEKKAHDHFIILLGALAGGFIILIGAFALGFLSLDSKIDANYDALNNNINSNYKELDDKFESTQELLVKINTQMGYLTSQTPQPSGQSLPTVK